MFQILSSQFEKEDLPTGMNEAYLKHNHNAGNKGIPTNLLISYSQLIKKHTILD